MDIQALFGLSVLMSFVAFGLVTKLYLWPRLRIAERDDALVALVAPHTFRFVCVGSNVAPVGITRYGETIEATPPAQRRPARSPAAMSRLSRQCASRFTSFGGGLRTVRVRSPSHPTCVCRSAEAQLPAGH
jgi:hypothetical protein